FEADKAHAGAAHEQFRLVHFGGVRRQAADIDQQREKVDEVPHAVDPSWAPADSVVLRACGNIAAADLPGLVTVVVDPEPERKRTAFLVLAEGCGAVLPVNDTVAVVIGDHLDLDPDKIHTVLPETLAVFIEGGQQHAG